MKSTAKKRKAYLTITGDDLHDIAEHIAIDTKSRVKQHRLIDFIGDRRTTPRDPVFFNVCWLFSKHFKLDRTSLISLK